MDMHVEGLCSNPSIISAEYCEVPDFKYQKVLGFYSTSVIAECMVLAISFPMQNGDC